MSPHELLHHLDARGVEVRVVGLDLLLAPKSRMTTAMKEAVERMKPELLGLLRESAAERAAEPARPFREAISLLARLVAGGSRFEVLSGDGRDNLVWFAPSGMSHDTMGAVARLEPEIIEVLRTTGPIAAAGARP